MKFNITDKELTKIMKNLVILCDTREKRQSSYNIIF